MSPFKRKSILSPEKISEHDNSSSASILDYIFTKEPIAEVNLFNLIGHGWIGNSDLSHRASIIFENLNHEYKLLFNCIFWNKDRFQRFCIGPSSCIGHHSFKNGNLMHTIETCEHILNLQNNTPHVHKGLSLILGLLHDAGKADEYEQSTSGKWYLSKRGNLLGHKLTIIEWVVTATTKYNLKFKKDHYECLLNGLSAVANAPEWAGFRPPATFESILLSHADRLSGSQSLFQKTAIKGDFGEKHKHLSSRFFWLSDDGGK